MGEEDLRVTLPGVAPGSAVLTDVRDVFGIWDSLTPRVGKPIGSTHVHTQITIGAMSKE